MLAKWSNVLDEVGGWVWTTSADTCCVMEGWQAMASWGKLSKWNPTNWHRLESQHSYTYELLLTQTVFRLGGCRIFGVKTFWGVDFFGGCRLVLGVVDLFWWCRLVLGGVDFFYTKNENHSLA